MHLKRNTFALLFFFFLFARAQEPTSYYLPDGVHLNPNIPSPEQYLGWPLGKWHVSHDQLVGYMQMLSGMSDRMNLETYGKSEEDRPLLIATISSPSNLQHLEEIRKHHLELADPSVSKESNIDHMPVVVYMGYSIHGNEASGMNASMLVAYYLAAVQDAHVDSVLQNEVILIDPCMNPDGSQRFASWVNAHKSQTLATNPNSREFNEAWPKGRTNHYWFDLNRDWLPLQQIESKDRIEVYHRWKPNVLTDHHEMGTNSTFFFQPGVPSRTNPLTPEENFNLTERIGHYHARALDKIGSLYYTKESFDDYYYGKGSTYPDINGGVGILFEQASSRGHKQQSIHGELTFAFTIRNQFTTSLSTMDAALDLRLPLLNFQRDFYQSALMDAKKDPIRAYVVSCPEDPVRFFYMQEILEHHRIRMYSLNKSVAETDQSFDAGKSLIIPLQQPQYRLIKALFESPRSFQDSLFYDVSSWTLPLAFNVRYVALDRKHFRNDMVGAEVGPLSHPVGKVYGEKSDYGYVFQWDACQAPRLVSALLRRNLVVKTATKPFTSFTAAGSRDFGYGTVLVPAQRQGALGEKEIYSLLKELAAKEGIDIFSLTTSLTLKGIDIGSPGFVTIRRPKVLLVVGDGVNPYDAGEVWQLLDKQVGMDVVMVEKSLFNTMELESFNTVVMVDGIYSELTVKTSDKLQEWVEDGGTLIATRSAIQWCRERQLINLVVKEHKLKRDSLLGPNRDYAYLDRDRGSQAIGGAIFETKVDLTHPLCYGISGEILPVFRRDTVFYLPPRNRYATPVIYSEQPLLSGYASQQMRDLVKGSAAVSVHVSGKGRIICMADDPNFRGFWYGTQKLFVNAVFFGPIVDKYAAEPVPRQRQVERKDKPANYED